MANTLRTLPFLFLILLPLSALGQEEGIAAFQAGDHAAALRLLLPHAEKGDGQSQFIVGMINEFGLAGDTNKGEAARWYLKAHEQGVAPASLYLGAMNQFGQGMPIDLRRATTLYHAAAENGSRIPMIRTQAAAQLGEIYYDGGLGQRELDSARIWLTVAGEGGHVDAQFRLGWIYAQGEGTAQSDSLAIIWLRRSSIGGSTRAMGLLGVQLMKQGEQSMVEAYKWAMLAAELDPLQATTTGRLIIREYLTPAQIKEAERLMEAQRKEWSTTPDR